MRIQHNILAMNSYRNYTNNTSALGKNLERLSSGYKINRAGDDAAGLAISEKMRAQITGLDAAQKNVKDGISLVKTAEGAMQEIQDMLNRMEYLATQSATGTYDAVDREALQKEVNQLRDEIDRIAESANFNGIALLDGKWSKTPSAINIAGSYDWTNITSELNAADRLLPEWDPSKDDEKYPWMVNTQKTVLDSYSLDGQEGEFEIDFSKLEFSVRVSNAAASKIDKAGGTAISLRAAFGTQQTIKITIGGVDFTVRASAISSTATVNIDRNGKIKIEGDARTALMNAIAAAITNASAGKVAGVTAGQPIGTATINSVQWNVSMTGDKLTFKQVLTPTKASETRMDFKVTMQFTSSVASAAAIGSKAQVEFNITGSLLDAVQVKQLAIKEGGSTGAESVFKLEEADIDDAIRLTIGDKSVILALGKDSEVNTKGDNVVDLTDMEKGGIDMAAVITRIAQKFDELGPINVTAKNKSGNNVTATFEIGAHGSESSSWGLAFRRTDEIKGFDDVLFTDLKGLFDALFTIEKGEAKPGSKEQPEGGETLYLQIGDTSDDFNRLGINIEDMHVAAMKYTDAEGTETDIGEIDIRSADKAADAIDVIRNAINYVSGVRGDLGAYQNRLEHTQNNLSVMAENIQDAESTIRDTDVAEEMMAYVKNNILVQSAQAMLAQANQVPQGVLQLLG